MSVLKNLDMKNTVLYSLVEFNLKFRGRCCFLFRTNLLSHKPEHRNPHMHCCENCKSRKHWTCMRGLAQMQSRKRVVRRRTPGSIQKKVGDFRLPLWCKYVLRSYGMLHSLGLTVTDAAEQTMGLTIKGQAAQKEFLVCPLNMRSIGYPTTSVTKYQSTTRNIPEYLRWIQEQLCQRQAS